MATVHAVTGCKKLALLLLLAVLIPFSYHKMLPLGKFHYIYNIRDCEIDVFTICVQYISNRLLLNDLHKRSSAYSSPKVLLVVLLVQNIVMTRTFLSLLQRPVVEVNLLLLEVI